MQQDCLNGSISFYPECSLIYIYLFINFSFELSNTTSARKESTAMLLKKILQKLNVAICKNMFTRIIYGDKTINRKSDLI